VYMCVCGGVRVSVEGVQGKYWEYRYECLKWKCVTESKINLHQELPNI